MDEEKYVRYDEIVNCIMTNVLVEEERCGKFLLWDFNPDCPADMLWFNVTSVAASLHRRPIYLNMPFFEYIKFKFNHRRHNLRFFGILKSRKLNSEFKTSVFIIMDFIAESLKIENDVFAQINHEYYGWDKR